MKRHGGDAVDLGDEKLPGELWKKPRALLSYKELGEGRGKGSALRQGGGGELVLRRALRWARASLLFLLPQECTNIFSKGGGEELAKYAGVPFLGEWPLEQSPSRRGRRARGAVGALERRQAVSGAGGLGPGPPGAPGAGQR